MPTSQNGWSASPDLRIRPLVVAGESFSPGIRDDDDVYEVLRYVAEQMHERVEPIVRGDWHQADEWGFYYRANANDPNSLSNHSSATAFDYNATRHPNGVPTRDTFTPAQIAETHKILAELDGVVRWGGDYTGTPDAMHFEINANAAAVRAVANRLREEIDMPLSNDDLTKIRDLIRTELDDAIGDVPDVPVDNPSDKGPKRSKLGVILFGVRNSQVQDRKLLQEIRDLLKARK